MELREILKRRRMVRAYDPEPVPRETVERIVAAARRAPSAGFSQGQRFVVVTDEEQKRGIADTVGEEFYVEQGFAPWISGAAALVVVCTREGDYHDRYRQPDKVDESGTEIEWPVPYWYVDAGKAAMLVLLAAIDEGLAAGVRRAGRADGTVPRVAPAAGRRCRRRGDHARQGGRRHGVRPALEPGNAAP